MHFATRRLHVSIL